MILGLCVRIRDGFGSGYVSATRSLQSAHVGKRVEILVRDAIRTVSSRVPAAARERKLLERDRARARNGDAGLVGAGTRSLDRDPEHADLTF